MKKVYVKPAMRVVELRNKTSLLQDSIVRTTTGNAGLNYGGGGSGSARVRENPYDVWSDDWSQ